MSSICSRIELIRGNLGSVWWLHHVVLHSNGNAFHLSHCWYCSVSYVHFIVPAYSRNVLPPSSRLKMATVCPLETLMPTYQTT
jgi:hypothetical protein